MALEVTMTSKLSLRIEVVEEALINQLFVFGGFYRGDSLENTVLTTLLCLQIISLSHNALEMKVK